MKIYKLTGWLILYLIACNMAMAQAPKTVIKGTVLDDDGEPAISVVIRDKDENGEVYGITDLEGKFSIKTDPTATLHFSGLTYQPKTVKLKGKTNINVVIGFESQTLDEVVITAKRVIDKFVPEQTDIEIIGNQCIIRPKVKIPKQIFKPDSRIIVQSVLVNNTRDTEHLFRPAVVTGRRYAIALDRILEFDLSRDPLSPYYQKSQTVDGNEVISYTDSLYMEHPDDDFRCDIFMYLVKYQKVSYKDTVVIAKGTVNPMRFFTYRSGASHLTENRYLPKPEKQQRGDKGEAKLGFLINSPDIDDKDLNNAKELEKIRMKLMEIENDPSAEFQSFSITGIASPEGPYQSNLKLAQKRTAGALNRIFGFMRPSTVAAIKGNTTTNAEVASWEEVIRLMQKDSLPVRSIQNILTQYANDKDAQFRQINRLPEYLQTIKPLYLPVLRRVEYSFNYSVMRFLTDGEIQELYKKDYRLLTMYEFWRMYVKAPDNKEREQICRQALTLYPEYMYLANELATLLIGQDKADSGLLKPFVNEQAPAEILCNQVMMLLKERNFDEAYALTDWLPDNENTRDIKLIAKAYNGNYEEAYERFAKEGGTNEVVLLLSMKKNEEAWEKVQELPDDALSDYLRATCANRLEKVTEAYAYIKRALAKDPSLKNIAYIDGDVVDLVQQLDEDKKEGKHEKV